MAKTILVTGATGKQGGAVIDALLASPQASQYTIIAVTRNPSSPSAENLKKKGSSVKVIQGDLDDPTTIFKNANEAHSEPIWGVFSVQLAMGGGANPDGEERQGKALVDASIKNDVKFFIYSSVDRGGDKKSYDNPTNIPHFISKHNIEHHLVDSAAGTQMDYFVLRPTAFFSNLSPDFPGKGFATSWKVALKDRPLQLIATSDIGAFAALGFADPARWKGKFLSLAGDDITFADANKVFKEKVGHDIPLTFEFVAHGFLWAVKEVGLMMKWFYTDGYGSDIKELRKIHPGLMDFGTWLEKESKFETK